MKLWCEVCGTTHFFALRDVERIVYALLGHDLDVRSTSRLCEPEEWCLRDLLAASYDTEGYRAWVEHSLASRTRDGPATRRRPRLRALPAALALVAAAAAVVAGLLFARASGPEVRALAPNSIGVIDPGRNALVAEIPVGSRPTRLASRAASVWVVNADDATVSRIDTASARVTGTFAAPAATVAAGEDGVWTLGRSGKLARIDPDDETVASVTHVDLRKLRPYDTPALAVGAGGVWVGEHGSVLAVADGRTRTLTSDIEAQDVAVGQDAVWVLNRSFYPGGSSPVVQLDRETGARLASVFVGPDPAAIALGAGGLWALASGSRTVLRIDPDSGRVTASIRVGESPKDVAVGAGAVWVANNGDRTVSRIDPRTNRVVATIPLGERPDGIAVAGGRVWVSVY